MMAMAPLTATATARTLRELLAAQPTVLQRMSISFRYVS
jgi:hypothetical protein